MAYSTSPKTLEGIRSSLEKLESGSPQAWKVEPGNEHYWARRVREALYIARLHPDQFPGLAAAAERFSIRVVGSGRVEAVATPGRRVEAAALTPGAGEDAMAQGGGSTFGRAVPVVGLSTAEAVIGSWLAQSPSQDSIVFADTVLDEENLTKLHRWAASRTPKMMFFVNDGSLTLAVKDADAFPHSWHPAEQTKPEVLDI